MNALGQFLPNHNLIGSEVCRTGRHPIGGGLIFDVWEGEYLDCDKVAVKVVRLPQEQPNWEEVGAHLLQ